jgi:hypothetical protein
VSREHAKPDGRFFMVDDRIIATSNELIEEGKSAPAAPHADAVRGAHKILTCCVPNRPLPTDLSKLRAMLDPHMFGRDQRALRDDAVRVARQIDSLRRSPAR